MKAKLHHEFHNLINQYDLWCDKRRKISMESMLLWGNVCGLQQLQYFVRDDAPLKMNIFFIPGKSLKMVYSGTDEF